ncbi:hypothetical protein C2U54_22980 [Leclercia sp. LSNIH1]|nr:hypothetical protein C2U54_22980 [Leclercia sp. LSNIH1]POV33636.1 hypothetical protein C3388_15790 [Leclercia sp. LSNIH5]POW65897.1 hypothetical protein C3389_12785 [Leclercia sp. LSNIH2]HCH38223.1 hypothetical protein [Enterobacter sp.]
MFNGRKRTIHLGITSLITADIVTTVTNNVNELFVRIKSTRRISLSSRAGLIRDPVSTEKRGWRWQNGDESSGVSYSCGILIYYPHKNFRYK